MVAMGGKRDTSASQALASLGILLVVWVGLFFFLSAHFHVLLAALVALLIVVAVVIVAKADW